MGIGGLYGGEIRHFLNPMIVPAWWSMWISSHNPRGILDTFCFYWIYFCRLSSIPVANSSHESTTKSSLKVHIEAMHDGAKYPSYQCEYKATDPGNLQRHIDVRHTGIKHPFDQYEYYTTNKECLSWSVTFWKSMRHEILKNVIIDETNPLLISEKKIF